MKDPELDALDPDEDVVLSEIVNRVLDRGAVITGEVVITVAGVDLIQLGLNLYLASAEKARTAGLRSARTLPPRVAPGGPEAPEAGSETGDVPPGEG